MCAPRGGRAKQHGGTDRWEEPKEMSMWNEQANEKVPGANEKVPRRNLPPDAARTSWNELGDTGKRHFMIETLL